MKKLVLTLSFAFITAFVFTAKAQVSLNINVGSQPQWGPAGYDHAAYYYLPDIESYYSVPQRKFIYLNNNGGWIHSNSLPARYASYNLYNGYKVVINEPKPYLHFKTHKVKYVKYKGVKSQGTIKAKNFKSTSAKGNSKKGVGVGNGNGKAKGGGKGKH